MSDTNSPDGRALPRPEPGSPDEDIHDVLAEMNADLAPIGELATIPAVYVKNRLARIDAALKRDAEKRDLNTRARLGGADATIHAAERALGGVLFRPTGRSGIDYYYAENRLYIMRNTREEFSSFAFVHTDSPEKAGRYMRDHGGWIDTDPEIHTLQNLVDASEDYVVFLVTVPDAKCRKEIRFAKSETVRTLDREEDDESEKLKDIRRILPESIDRFYVTLNKTWNGYEPVVSVLLKHPVPEVGNHE